MDVRVVSLMVFLEKNPLTRKNGDNMEAYQFISQCCSVANVNNMPAVEDPRSVKLSSVL